MSTFADLGIVHPGVFCAAVLLLNLTPGPDTAFIVGQSVTHGRRAGLMSVLGISAGCMAHTLALSLGLSALLAASAGAFTIVKVAGAVYLVFLGVRMILATLRKRHDVEPPGVIAPRRSGSRTLAQGFVTNVLNPKVILFFLSFFPQFVTATSPSKGLAFVVLGALLIVISTVYNGLVAWLAGGITHRMRGAPRMKAWLERSVGTAFVALGARIAFADR
ncbi:MAG: LysE family translocator [Burkholderiaceae bacterium]